MQEAQAIIERIRRVSAITQQLDVAVEKTQGRISAGQMFLARATFSYDPYLREPWIPVKKEGSYIVIERPVGRSYTPGQVVNLLGPIGKPFPLNEKTRTLLLIAHEATPVALLLLAETALKQGAAVAMMLGGGARHYPVEALPQEVEVIRGDDDGGWPDPARTLRWADQIFAVAPPPSDVPYYSWLLSSVHEARVEVPHGHVYGLFQPPMPCGVGACQACLIHCGSEEIPTCVEGPAFDLLTVNAVKVEGKA